MFAHLLLSLLTLPLLVLQTAPPSSDPPDGDDPPENKDKPKVQFDGDQAAEVRRIAAKEAREAATKARADERAKIDAERTAAETAAETKKAEERGEFDKVKATLASERDAAATERDTLKADLDVLRPFFDRRLEAALKDLPDAIKAFDPGPDASVPARADWLVKALEQADKLDVGIKRGNGPDRAPASERNVDVEREGRTNLARYSI
jgi:hypothetical protein